MNQSLRQPINFTPIPQSSYLYSAPINNPNTTTQTEVKPTTSKKTNHAILFLSIMVVILIVITMALIGSYFLYIQPRQQAIKYSKQTLVYIPSLRNQIKDVSKSLSDMYALITGQTIDSLNTPNTLLRLNTDKFVSQLKQLNREIKGEVAGVSTNVFSTASQSKDLIENNNNLYNKLKRHGGFYPDSGNVLGEAKLLESKTTTRLRQLKEIALDGSAAVKNSNNSLIALDILIIDRSGDVKQEDLTKIVNNLRTANSDAKDYLTQADKTNTYYNKISDIQIQLEPLLVSYLTLIEEAAKSSTPDLYIGRINEILLTMQKLDNIVKSISSSDLPTGLGDLHKDNIKVLDILVDNIQAIKSSLQNKNFSAFLSAVLHISQDLEPLVTRSLSLEISFWQNNKILRQHQTVLDNYQREEKNLKYVIEKNKLPWSKS